MRPLSRIGALALAACAFSWPAQGAGAQPKEGDGNTIYWNNDLDLIIKTQELKRPRTEKVLGMLDIRPGMTVLDIGAGSGQATFMLAERMKGQGAVYATEIDPKLVAYLTEQAQKRGATNVHPVLVDRNGVDPFYAKHRYDLILLYNVIANIRNSGEYLGEMRRYLAHGGRLVVCDEKLGGFVGFSKADFSDVDGFIEALANEPPESPFRRSVLEPAKKEAERVKGGRRKLVKAVVFHLNRLIGRIDLLTYYTAGLKFKREVVFTPEEENYALWRLYRLKLVGIPGDRNIKEIPQADFTRTQFLNKLLVIQRFRRFFIWKGPHPYLTQGRNGEWARDREEISARIKEAGYRLEKEYELLPFQGVWIFSTPP